MVLPLRTKSNIRFDPKHGVFKYGPATGARTAKKTNGAMMLLRTMYTLELIEDMIDKNKSSTLREMYYISEGWGKAKFHSQDESNMLAEDLEIVTKCMREDFKLRPEENGASVIGNITIEEFDRKGTDEAHQLPGRCRRFRLRHPVQRGEGEGQAHRDRGRFHIAIETGGMFDRLVENGFAEDYNSVLVHLKGQPARIHQAVHQAAERGDEPAGHRVHRWRSLVVPDLRLGRIRSDQDGAHQRVPGDAVGGVHRDHGHRHLQYELPTDKLTDMDIRALNAELNDPRFADRYWKDEIETMLKLNKKAEQQALAKYGLDFVTDKYMPDKLNELGLLKR